MGASILANHSRPWGLLPQTVCVRCTSGVKKLMFTLLFSQFDKVSGLAIGINSAFTIFAIFNDLLPLLLTKKRGL
jgi:hypothetical protein